MTERTPANGPERIWAAVDPDREGYHMWNEHLRFSSAREYIRADLCALPITYDTPGYMRPGVEPARTIPIEVWREDRMVTVYPGEFVIRAWGAEMSDKSGSHEAAMAWVHSNPAPNISQEPWSPEAVGRAMDWLYDAHPAPAEPPGVEAGLEDIMDRALRRSVRSVRRPQDVDRAINEAQRWIDENTPAEPPMDEGEWLKEAVQLLSVLSITLNRGDPTFSEPETKLLAHLRRRVTVDRDAVIGDLICELEYQGRPIAARALRDLKSK